MSASYLLTQILPAAVQPSQSTDQDHWWKYVALTLISLLVISIGTLTFLIARSFVMEED